MSKSEETSPELKAALSSRLEFRSTFLKTVEIADSRMSTDVKVLWDKLQALLAQVKRSTNLGKEVPASFSVKVQRKLASTVPPRPVIEVAQDAAFKHLEQICKDAGDVVDVLNYHDSHSLMVSVHRSPPANYAKIL